jgi:hypothetical protein
MEQADQPLDVHSWLVVITFMIVIAIVIHPIRIPLPIPALSSSSASRSCQSTVQQQQQQQDNHNSDDSGSALAQNPAAANTATGINSLAVATNQKQKKKKIPYHFTLDIATAPVLGVLFLLATKSIGGDSVRDGIVGAPESGVEPYAVMILFFSLVSNTSVLEHICPYIACARIIAARVLDFLCFFSLSYLFFLNVPVFFFLPPSCMSRPTSVLV